MPEIKPDGTKIYHTRDKQYEVESGLLQIYFAALEGIKDIIVTSDSAYTDPRIDAMAIYVASFALNEKEFDALCQKRDEEIAEALNKYPNDAKLRNRAIYDANIRAIVRANALFDRFMGYRVKQEVMRLVPEGMEKEIVEKYPGIEDKWACKA